MAPILDRILDRNLEGLARLAVEVQAFLTGAGVGEMAVFRVQLALEEILRNLIEHGEGFRTGQARVRIQVDGDQVTVTVEDDGHPFDPRTAPPFDPSRPLEERTGRGMGLHLLGHLMDDIQYDRLETVNRLRLVVRGARGGALAGNG